MEQVLSAIYSLLEISILIFLLISIYHLRTRANKKNQKIIILGAILMLVSPLLSGISYLSGIVGNIGLLLILTALWFFIKAQPKISE